MTKGAQLETDKPTQIKVINIFSSKNTARKAEKTPTVVPSLTTQHTL